VNQIVPFPKVFDYEGVTVNATVVDGQAFFAASDVCRALGVEAKADAPKPWISLNDLFALIDTDLPLDTKKRILRVISRGMGMCGVDDRFYNMVYGMCLAELRWERTMERAESYEHELQHWVADNVEPFFGPGFKLVKKEFPVQQKRGKRADFLLTKDGELYVVECKVGPIGPKELRQIEQYLFLSGISRGIVVGSVCDVQLPSNVTFQSHGDQYQPTKS
jgi:hypothetical protein